MAVSGTDLLWGCPQMNFKANPPFNEMRQSRRGGICDLQKRVPHGPNIFPEFLRPYEFLLFLRALRVLRGEGSFLQSG